MAGIGSFTGHAKEAGFGGQWLNKWKDDKKIVVWLHTMIPPSPCWGHSFQFLDVQEDKENGGAPKRVMRYPRFVSPDPEPVHRNQYFRKDDDVMRVLPDRDPFLLLREWLRRSDHLGLEDTVFQWRDPKDNSVVVWNRGELSGLVKRGRANFGHSLDTRLEYIFVVVLDSDPERGVYLARESQLLGKKVSEVITQQQSMLGPEGGDPLLHPYPFVWEFNKTAKSPMDTYKAYKAEGIECTDAVWSAISSEDPPDPSEFCTAKDGDLEKIRAAMEQAAQVELPFDQIFSEDSGVRLQLAMGAQRTRPAGAQRAPAQPQRSAPAAPQRPAPAPAAQQQKAPTKPAATAGAAQRPGNGAQRPQQAAAPAPTPSAAGQPRRRKVETPAQPPPAETIPCDDCKHPMLATDKVCSKCGAKYETDDAPLQQQAAPTSAPVTDEPAAEESCFSCGAAVSAGICTACNLDQGDDIPF